MVIALCLSTGVARAGEPDTGRNDSGDGKPTLDSGVLRRFAATEVSTQDLAGDEGRIKVEVLTAGDQRMALTAIRSLGGAVLGNVDGDLVLAELPLRSLAALESSAGVATLRLPLRHDAPQHHGAATTGQHVVHTNAASWHAAGYDGSGIKIGIIDSFHQDAWSEAETAGDLPAPAGTFCMSQGTVCPLFDTFPRSSTHTSHGVGVAEVIHDLAPAADLYLARATTATDHQAAVDWFAAHGVTIVNRSLAARLDGPGDGAGSMGAVASSAVIRGIAWFNSAGNHAGRAGRRGGYHRAAFTDTDGDGWHEFPDGSETLAMDCGPSPYFQGLRWNDWAGSLGAPSTTDYDIFVFETSADFDDSFTYEQARAFAQAVGDNAQGGASTNQPLEQLGNLHQTCTQERDHVAIRLFDAHGGTEGDTIELMLNGGSFEHWSNPHSATQPISDSADAGVFSIGAVEADHEIADYSSQGPTNDGRIKPDFTARTSITGHEHDSGSGFTGTSAASPVAAGLAALVFDAGLATTPFGLRTWLTNNAVVDRGPAGPDDVYGRGELILPPPRPTNDDLATASVIPGGGGAVAGSNLGATAEPGEPSPSCRADAAGNSVWWRWTAPIEGAVTFDTLGSDFDTVLSVHTGDNTTDLTEVACGDDIVPDDELRSRVTVDATAGTTYHVRVDGATANAGAITLNTKPTAVPDEVYVPLVPARLADSRNESTVDGSFRDTGMRPTNSTWKIQISGRGGVPVDASAAVVNLTVLNGDQPGHATVHPCGRTPNASSANYLPGTIEPNELIAKLSKDGEICVSTLTPVDVIVDVVGYVPARSPYVALTPVRYADSRDEATFDGKQRNTGQRPPGTTWEIPVAGRGVVPSTATAVVVNVTVTGGQAPGFATVHPCGRLPVASSLNYDVGVTRPNELIAKLSPDGNICIYTLAATDVVVDVVGYVR